jgi:two-component system, response regulator PdtaR
MTRATFPWGTSPTSSVRESGVSLNSPVSAAMRRRAKTAPAGLHILVVEDELWAALDMEWVVRKLGHEVIGPAATAEEAIRLAEAEMPDLVLMDIRLANGSDGVTAAIEIRRRFGITSLFVSAHGELATRQRAEAAEPAGFIEKPFAPETLAGAIEKALAPKTG